MKKTLLILCALLLTSIGANAQSEYKFSCKDWVSMDLGRLAATGITYNEDNTITVAPTNGASGTNNVALGNSQSQAVDGTITTSGYYITSEQKYFVVIGSDLNTSYTDNTYSQLWWMNGYNNGLTAKPDYVVELTDEENGEATGEALFAWDCSSYLTAGEGGNITLSGWTGFGLTSTTGTSTISYIGFYTAEQIDALITGKPYEFVNTDWVGVSDRSANEGQVTYSEDESNTITVTSTGANNIALENKSENGGYVTADYYVTAEQHWFVIKGTDLSTQDGDSYIWFMNGVNQGTNVAPSETITLDDGSIMLAWDLTKTGLDGGMTSERNYLTGYICFGLTSSDEETHTSTITYIGFYTEAEVEKYLTMTPYTFNAKDWAATSDHTEVTNVTYGEDNTITVTASGDQNVALSNSPSANNNDPTIGITTGLYTITNEQIYFVVIGSDLSTAANASKLWWMNGSNLNGADPTTTTLDDGRIVFAWDLSNTSTFPDATNLFDGWTCFALTSTAADNKSTIYDINFYTKTQVDALVGIEWEMTEAGWGTLILPFDAAIPTDEGGDAALTLYAGSALELSNDGSTITVGEASESIAANTPYLVSGTTGTYTFTGTYVEATGALTDENGLLTGTYETLDCDALLAAAGDDTVYLLQNQDNVVAFYPVVETSSEGATLTPYHCYLTLSGDVKPTSLRLPGMETGIVAVEGAEAEADGAIYDLSGRKVSKTVKGVYIQNGKKVLVK